MGEPDFATKAHGWWAGSEEVARIDELLAALNPKASALEAENRRLRAALRSIVDAYDARSELFTNDADCAANLRDRAALQEKP